MQSFDLIYPRSSVFRVSSMTVPPSRMTIIWRSISQQIASKRWYKLLIFFNSVRFPEIPSTSREILASTRNWASKIKNNLYKDKYCYIFRSRFCNRKIL